MRVRYFALFLFSSILAGSVLPLSARASAQPLVLTTGFLMPMISGLGYGTYQTALKTGDTPQIRTCIESFMGKPVVSADLSALGVSSSTVSGGDIAGHLIIGGIDHNPVYCFNFWSFSVGPGISDGMKVAGITAVDPAGNIATGTAQVLVDNALPMFALSNISFSAAPPKGGDMMYLSGSADGTGSALRVYDIRTSLRDANGKLSKYGEMYCTDSSLCKTYMQRFSEALATSTDGRFTAIPIILREDLAYKIVDAASMKVTLIGYDGSGHIITTSLTVPVPKTPADPCIAAGNCASNVLFLPGIEASRLYEDIPCEAGVCSTRLWEPNGDALASRLAHDASGGSVNADIYASGIIDNAYVPVKGNIYKSFIEQMNGLVATGILNAWEAIPYDWRLAPEQILSSGTLIAPGRVSYLVATSSPYIIQELKRLAATSKSGKVTIIAHSNGGLLTKALTEKLGDEASALIDKLIFVAVPQVGTPQAIGALLHGYDQGLPIDFLPYELSGTTARTLAKNMPMTYNLLPSASYFTQIDDPVATFTDQPLLADFRTRYGNTIHSQERLHTFITDAWRTASSTAEGLNYPSVGNESLLTRAEDLHAGLDTWAPPAGVTLYEIAGWGEKTLAGIDYYQGTATRCDTVMNVLSGCTRTPKIDYRPRLVLDGDGTVVTPSALWTPGAKRYWVDLRDYNGFFGTTKHASILEVPQLRTFVQNIVTNNKNASLPQYISTSTPINQNQGTELHFTLHSPLTLNLYDDLGRHTGISTTTGELEENIPESRYLKFGEVQYISVPSTLHTRLVMNAYAEGSFTLEIEEMNGETVVASTTFAGIPSAASAVATMDIPSGGLAGGGALAVDEDGNGVTDITVASRLNDTAFFKTPLTVTADNQAIILGEPVPPLTATLSGFIGDDTATSSDIIGAPECSVAATTTIIGSYLITCTVGTLASETYDFTAFVPGTLTVRYRWDGFSQPLSGTAHQAGQSTSVFKAGSTIPIKFQLKTSGGAAVQADVAPLWSVDDGASAPYKWDSSAAQYVYNWSTKGFATGLHTVSAKLDDGQTYSAIIRLK